MSVDLCTLSDVRSFLQKTSGDTDQDAVISSLITRASTAILKDCQREFAPATASEARTFTYDGSGRLSLAPYDLRSASLVRIDTDDAAPTTLASSQYRLWPLPAVNGTYLTVLFDTTVGGTRNNWRDRLVEITGAWGFQSVPEDVKHAAVVTTAIWLRRDVAAFSSTFSLDEDRVERPEVLPSSVRGTLAPYRRHEFA